MTFLEKFFCEYGEYNLMCPRCGGNMVHITGIEAVKNSDAAYDVDLLMECASGCKYTLKLTGHKGWTFVGACERDEKRTPPMGCVLVRGGQNVWIENENDGRTKGRTRTDA